MRTEEVGLIEFSAALDIIPSPFSHKSDDVMFNQFIQAGFQRMGTDSQLSSTLPIGKLRHARNVIF